MQTSSPAMGHSGTHAPGQSSPGQGSPGKNSPGAHAFETPENILVAYAPAGLGSRFFAWFIDGIVRWILLGLLTLGLFFLAVSLEAVQEAVAEVFGELWDGVDSAASVLFVALGISTLLWGLGSFVYFFSLEYWLRGQTVGKRMMGLRVVKANGFALDASSIFLRNLFRIIDESVLLWLVPVFSPKSQRLGDMAAGTLVVRDEPSRLSPLREHLLARATTDIAFRVEGPRLTRLTPEDLDAMEMLLERWESMTPGHQETMARRLSVNIAERLQLPEPAQFQQLIFLEDVLTQALQRMSRRLG